MSTQSVLSELAIAPIIVRWTALLALAWLAHVALAGAIHDGGSPSGVARWWVSLVSSC